jgi:hypothetical protein
VAVADHTFSQAFSGYFLLLRDIHHILMAEELHLPTTISRLACLSYSSLLYIALGQNTQKTSFLATAAAVDGTMVLETPLSTDILFLHESVAAII